VNGKDSIVKKLRLVDPHTEYDQKGFTLLELLVSFALIGIIAAIIAGALKSGLDAVDKGDRKIESLERLRSSAHIISAQVQSQLPLTFLDDDGKKKFYFSGNRETLGFPTTYSIWKGLKGYVHVQYTIHTDENDKRYMTASERIIGTDHTVDTILFTELDDAYFEYFFRDPLNEEDTDWVQEWEDRDTIPEKIKMQVTYNGKVIPLFIPIRISGSSGRKSLFGGNPSRAGMEFGPFLIK
jgi:prepilin-type N-terminal cleavage/methylation domain-containing protein